MKKSFLLGVAAAALLSACSNDELVSIKSNDSNSITFGTFVNNTTRSTTDITNVNIGDYANGFSVYAFTNHDDADNPTPYATYNSENWYRLLSDEHVEGSGTIKTDGDDSKWIYGNTQYWKDGNKYHFHAIAPYGYSSEDAAATNRHWDFTPDKTDLANGKITFTNIADDKSADGTQDLIYSYKSATGKASGNDEVKFTFSHLLSRVKFRFKGVDTNPVSVNVKVTDVTINDTYDYGEFNVTNHKEATDDDTDTTLDGSDKSTLADQDWTFPTTDSKKTKLSFGGTDTFINTTVETDHKYLIPIAEKTAYTATIQYEIKATVNDNGKVRTYKVTQKDVELPEVEMLKGYSYVYEFTVKTGGGKEDGDNNLIEPIVLNVQVVEDWHWDSDVNTDTDVYRLNEYGYFVSPDEAQAGDILLKDGQIIHISENMLEYLKYTPADGEEPDQDKLALKESINKHITDNIAGVVYYKFSDEVINSLKKFEFTTGEGETEKTYSNTNGYYHGLAVATEDLDETTKWAESTVFYRVCHGLFTENDKIEDWEWLNDGITYEDGDLDFPSKGNNVSNTTVPCGYKNTQFWIALYNIGLATTDTSSNDYKLQELDFIKFYLEKRANNEITDVPNTSTWYIPSKFELDKLRQNDIVEMFAPFDENNSYWISNENSAARINYYKYPTPSWGANSKKVENHIRLVCAF